MGESNNMSKKISFIAFRCILYIFLVVVACLLWYSLLGYQFNSTLLDVMGIDKQKLLLIGAVIILCLGISGLFCLIDNISEQHIRVIEGILFLVMLFCFFIMLLNFYVIPITDSYAILDLGKYFGYHPGEKLVPENPYFSYFSKYSNNYFLVILFMYLSRVLAKLNLNGSYMPFFILNMIALYGSMVLSWLCVKEIGGRRAAAKMLMLVTLNPLFYMLVFWVYSCTLSIPLLVLIMWVGIKIYKSELMIEVVCWAIMEGALAIISYFIRPTSLIPLIALGIIGILLCIRKKNVIKKIFITTICIMLSGVLIYNVVHALSDDYFSEASVRNYPITHWLMMGSHGDGEYNASDDAYTNSFNSTEEMKAANIEMIKENYSQLGITGTFNLFIKKMNTTFAEGWSQVDIRLAQDTKFGFLYQYLAGDKKDLFEIYCQAFRAVTLLFMLLSGIGLLKENNTGNIQWLYMLTFLGGVAFYCFWEAKEIYSLPFVPIMLMSAENGGERLAKFVKKQNERISIESIKKKETIICILWLVASILFSWFFCSTEIERINYVVRTYSPQICETIDTMEYKGDAVVQSFYADSFFNEIELRATVVGNQDNDIEYEFQLLDADRKTIFRQEISANDVKNGYITVQVPIVKNEEKLQYFVQIKQLSDTGNALCFWHRIALETDNYEGVLWMNKNQVPYDLFMSVYYKYTALYMGKFEYLTIFLGLTVVFGGIMILFQKNKNLQQNKFGEGFIGEK